MKSLIAAAAVLPMGIMLARAQSTATLNINATVSTRAELTLSPTTINFPDASPTTMASVPADSTVTVTAKVRTAGTPTLKVMASGDLISGGNTIPIGSITWTASSTPFVGGTMNKTASQDAASFSSGSGSYSGTYTYSLANSWTYAVGSYTASATYTLTAP